MNSMPIRDTTRVLSRAAQAAAQLAVEGRYDSSRPIRIIARWWSIMRPRLERICCRYVWRGGHDGRWEPVLKARPLASHKRNKRPVDAGGVDVGTVFPGEIIVQLDAQRWIFAASWQYSLYLVAGGAYPLYELPEVGVSNGNYVISLPTVPNEQVLRRPALKEVYPWTTEL